MITYLLMGLLVLGIVFSTLWDAKYVPDKNSFMSVEDTTFLRGFWCIIVVLVHVPAAYQNRIQDMLGSFAYIGVTFFFMTSAYGLKWSTEYKPGYMDHFWRKRLPILLTPALIANAIAVLISGMNGNKVAVLSFININNWVKVLLLYYVFFWLVYHIFPKIIGGGYWQDVVMCSIVLGCSLIDKMTDFKITSIWIVEPLGFAYGIIAANYRKQIGKWIRDKWMIKSACIMVISGTLGIVYLKYKSTPFIGDYILKIILGVVITSLIFNILGKFKVGNRVNRFLASISYEVYLLHHAVFTLFMVIAPHEINSGIFIVLSVGITIVASYGLKLVSELLRK